MKTGNKILWSGLLGIASLSLTAQPAQAKKVVSAKLQKQVVSVGNQTKVKTNNKKAVYSSSNSQVASINKLGVITAKKAGKTTITVKAKGYTAKTIQMTVKAKKGVPELPVALDEVVMSGEKITGANSVNAKFQARIKNTAKKGKIKKIEYHYQIQSLVKTTQTPAASQAPQQTAGDATATASPAVQPTQTLAATTKVTKQVVLSAKGIKPGKTVTAKCAGDVSGKVSAMHLQEVKLYTGEALYTYNVNTGKAKLTWGGADKTGPVFSGWVGKKSIYGKDTIRVCYTDRKGSYSFKDHVKAVDARDGKCKFSVDTSKINWNKNGIYKVYYRAKDKSGNLTTAWAKVQVFVPSTAESIADEVLGSITKKGWSQEKKLRAIYKYAAGHCAYVDSGSHSDWRKAAVNGIRYQSGDCFTFYSISRLLITRAGIPNLMVTRYPAVPGHHHWWNLVYVRGGWYHFDTTPRQRKGYFCLQTDAQLHMYSTGSTFRFRSDKLPKRATKKISRNPV